jgi:hypothetical protein
MVIHLKIFIKKVWRIYATYESINNVVDVFLYINNIIEIKKHIQ